MFPQKGWGSCSELKGAKHRTILEEGLEFVAKHYAKRKHFKNTEVFKAVLAYDDIFLYKQ